MIVCHHYSRELIDAARAGNSEPLVAACREQTVKLWQSLGVPEDRPVFVKTRRTYPAPQGGVIVESDVVPCDEVT